MSPKGFMRMLEILQDEVGHVVAEIDGVVYIPLDPVLQLLARFTGPSPVVWLAEGGEVKIAWPPETSSEKLA